MRDQDRAGALVERFWEQLLELEPGLGTQIGDERYDDRLSDPGPEGRDRLAQTCRSALDDAAAIDRSQLDELLRTTLDVLEFSCRTQLQSNELRLDRLQVTSHMWGPAQLLVDLGTIQRTDTPERIARYESRLRAIPAYMDAVSEIVREGVASGVTAPRVVAERTVAQVERLLAIPAEDSPALMGLPPDTAPELRQGLVDAVRDAAMPGYEMYLVALREALPHATESIGLRELPGGEQIYDALIWNWTTVRLPAQQIHDLGEEDLAKVQEERRAIAASLGHSTVEEAIAAYDATGRNRATDREELVRLAEEQVRRGWDAAPNFFGRLPTRNCEVRVAEEFREADMPFAWYQPPSQDGSRPGMYYVNAYQLDDRPLHHLATTTYHEASPGHHFQIAIEQEFDERPALRRFGGLMSGASFIEGWGLYSERLADEMELFVDDYERLGMLDAQAHRSARLVVDTGIHALGWTRDEALAKLEEAGVPRTDALIETDRYITLAGQALSYKIGQLEIERWRGQAAARDGFTLRAFHDRLLSLGSLPLPAIERELATGA
ncbi:MAG: DUF885 domain-containing protein [Actinomycetota bacterium]